MEQLAPAGDVYQAGTLSGNPLATAAGSRCCGACAIPRVYEELEERGARLEAGLAPFGRVQRVGSMLTLFARDGRCATSTTRRRATPSGTARSSATCSSAASTSRRRSSRRCSSRSRTATRRSTGRSRPSAASSRLTLWDDDRGRGGRARARSGPPRCGRSPERRAGLLAARATSVRARRRDDLRGLPPALRSAAAVRAAPTGERAAARRLPLRARARPRRRARRRRRRRRPRGADLASARSCEPTARTGDGAAWARRPRRLEAARAASGTDAAARRAGARGHAGRVG